MFEEFSRNPSLLVALLVFISHTSCRISVSKNKWHEAGGEVTTI
jgi:hypothetical protein